MLNRAGKVLVLASTFPAERDAEVPAFVRDLVDALHRLRPTSRLTVLAPQRRGALSARRAHAGFDEVRYRYAWPAALEALTDHGILPTLRQRPWLLPVVPGLFVGLARALRREIAVNRPDVIHAHWFTPQGIVAVREGRRAGVPVVITSHASDVRVWRLLPGIGPRLVRAHLPFAQRFTAVSARTLASAAAFFDAEAWAAIAARSAVIPMGVADVASARPPGRGDGRHVLFLGRLVDKKGVDDLVRACARLPLPDARLTIAGDGPERGALEALVRRSGLAGRVRFVGHVAGASKAALLASADVLALPSVVTRAGDAEGLPVVLLEGLAAGIPCVASDASGAGEVIAQGRSGWLVPQRDVPALADALHDALTMDASRRAEIVRAGRDAVAPFTWDRIATRYWQVLDEAVSA